MDLWTDEERRARLRFVCQYHNKFHFDRRYLIMKRIFALVIAAFMLLAAVACTANTAPIDNNGNNNNNNADTSAVTMTAQEILDNLKKSLGGSWASDTAETEDRMSGYYGLDMSQIESWAAESNSMSSLNMDCAVVLKVKDGYAEDAAKLLQQSFEQVLSYARMYNMDLQRVLQARLFVNGNYVALIIEGEQGDWEASDEDQAKFAADEAAKVDAAWSEIFDSAENSIVIPEDSGNVNMYDDETEGDTDDIPMLGG